jgi:hypothetical protein
MVLECKIQLGSTHFTILYKLVFCAGDFGFVLRKAEFVLITSLMYVTHNIF